MLVIHVDGSRSNYIKIAPIYKELARYNHVSQLLIETSLFSESDFNEEDREFLGLPIPNYFVDGIASEYISRVSKITETVKSIIEDKRPDFLLIYGDVDSTLGSALAGKITGVHTIHIESGLRNGVHNDNEELNRVIVDHIVKTRVVNDSNAFNNLIDENIPKSQILLAGNTLIDSLADAIKRSNKHVLDEWKLPKEYIIFTIHKDINLNSPERLDLLMDALFEISKHIHIIFLVQPRAKQAISNCKKFKDIKHNSNVFLTSKIPYNQFVSILMNSKCVITDSSALQDETTYLGIPCMTCLSKTHRQNTVNFGTNKLVGTDIDLIVSSVLNSISNSNFGREIPCEWDGKASKRIVNYLLRCTDADEQH